MRLEPLRIPVNRRGDWLIVRLRARGRAALGDATSAGDLDAAAALLTGALTDLLAGADLLATDARADDLLAWAISHGGDRLHATVASAVEQALWDLRARVEGVPIHALLGGARRDTITLYANMNRGTHDRSLAAFAERARLARADGFRAVKIAPFDEVTRDVQGGELVLAAEAGIARVAAVREALGDGIELLVDCHRRFDVESAVAVAARLHEYGVAWFEESVRGGEPAQLAEVRRRVPMRTAGGESLFGADAFRALIDAGAVDVVMPDVKHCGGLRETLRIAHLAAERGIGFAPHNPHGPIGTAHSLHVCAAAPEAERLEYQFREVEWSRAWVAPTEAPRDGHLAVPAGAGLGVELTDAP